MTIDSALVRYPTIEVIGESMHGQDGRSHTQAGIAIALSGTDVWEPSSSGLSSGGYNLPIDCPFRVRLDACKPPVATIS